MDTKLEPSAGKELDAKGVQIIVTRIAAEELAKEVDLSLSVVLIAIIVEYIEAPEELMEFASYSQLIYEVCKKSLNKCIPPLQLQMAAGGIEHALILSPTGQISVSGDNYGQLPSFKNKDRKIFKSVPVALLPTELVSQAAAGGYLSLLLTTHHRVLICGCYGREVMQRRYKVFESIPLPLLPGEYVRQAVAGTFHFLLLTTHNRVLGYGGNDIGQLGLGDNIQRNVLTPVPVPLLPGERITQIAACDDRSLLVTDHDRVLVCGENKYGQLGLDSMQNRYVFRENRSIFTAVPLPHLLPGEHIIKMAAGDYHTLLLTTHDQMLISGFYNFGGPRHNVFASIPLPLLQRERIVQIAAGSQHTLLLTNQRVLAWGNNEFGQLGLGHTKNRDLITPVPLTFLEEQERVAQIAAGGKSSLLLTTHHRVLVCGPRLGLGEPVSIYAAPYEHSFTPVTRAPWQTSMQQTHAFLTRLPTLITTTIDKTLQSKSPQLDLSHYFLGNWDPLSLLPKIRALSPTIEEVNLTNNRLYHWPIATLIQVLQAFPKTVKRINLSNNDLQQYASQLPHCLLELKWRQWITVICDELGLKEITQKTPVDNLADLQLDDGASASSASSASSTPSTSSAVASYASSATIPQQTSTRAGINGPFASIPPIKQISSDLQNLFEMPEEAVDQLLSSKPIPKKEPMTTSKPETMPEEKKPITKNYHHWLKIHAEQTGHLPHTCLAQLMTANLLIYQLRNCLKDRLYNIPHLLQCFDIYTQICKVANNTEDAGGYELLANLQQLGRNLHAIIQLLPREILQDITSRVTQFNGLYNAVNDGIQSNTTLKKGVEEVTPCIAAFKPLPKTEDTCLVM